MIAWALSVWANPLARKITIYAAITAAIFLSLRWYGNRQWAKGEAQGRQYMAREIERQKKEEWAAKEKEIAAAAGNIATEKRVVDAAAEQLIRDRSNLSRSLNDAMVRIQAERIKDYANAASVPDSRVWDDLRAISRELAAHP
jgi:hypothetical protein